MAGFLDGDGCINEQIIKRNAYRLGFQIHVSITFFQSTKRSEAGDASLPSEAFLMQLKNILPGGTLRKRIDGISEYAFVGPTSVQSVCEQLLPFLKIKHRQASFVLEITSQLRKNQSPKDFLRLCHIVDKIGELNDSKKRTISAAFVENHFKTLFPVETSRGADLVISDTRDTLSG